jgi:hypothetical protein
VGRIAFRADDGIEKQLASILEGMRTSPQLMNIDITQSAVVKAALRYGMPFLEMRYQSKPFGGRDDRVAAWLNQIHQWVCAQADLRGVELQKPIGRGYLDEAGATAAAEFIRKQFDDDDDDDD